MAKTAPSATLAATNRSDAVRTKDAMRAQGQDKRSDGKLQADNPKLCQNLS
jgi:hypothetical protein